MLDNKMIQIHGRWHSILGDEIPLIGPHDYVKLGKILTAPKSTAQESDGSVAYVLHYIRQKVKMWGADVLRTENIKTLVEEDDDVSDEDMEFIPMDENQDVRKNQLSRFDCIASLLASAECTVAQDIIRTLSQFPIALPLTIPDLGKKETFKVMLPLLVGPIIKWETKPGIIIENQLFNDKYKLIVAIRIGTNTPGKSVILNQLMASNFMFSSSCEPRAEYGIPHMINGSVEFTWLTQETCGVSLWNDVFENYYKEGSNEIALLANLHGDALDYPDHINFLKQLPSSFLIFLMPGCTSIQVNKLEALIGSKQMTYCCVDHGQITDKKKYTTIVTKFLMKDKTLKKIRIMFKEALNFDTSSFSANELKLGKSLQLTEGIEIHESQLLANFVKEKTCRYIKLEVMQLQRKLSDDLQINNELKDLMDLYIKILKLPLNKRIRALAHLEREISRISMMESSEFRNQAVSKREELRKSSLVDKNQKNEMKIRDEIAKIWTKVDSMSLGLEHFYRELGQLYKIYSINNAEDEVTLTLPELYAELLVGGHTIELLDGDTGSISGAWFSAICKHICNRFPKLRIFVISILGLQSSGKSTLLNALFACRFAVSVGRCTRGLFMRLLFLEKDLSDQIGIDAFVLIDTEGLGAPEKMDDPESEKKDRILATFAMGVSNLTILNVLGESTRDLTEILQIAIVTMARLEEAGIAPDIMMVQHISERNAAKLSEPEEKFRVALQEALKIANEEDIKMGIYNTDCLQILDERIKKGQLLKQFRPFKNGATANAPPSEQYHEDVVNLYNSIINDCKDSQSKMKFSEWNSLIQNYWNAVSHEDFAVRFKNIREIYEFIELSKRITKLKEAIDKTFLKHEESILQKIRTKLQSWSPHDRSNMNLNLRNESLQLIERRLQKIPNCNKDNCEECKKVNKEKIELKKHLKDKNNEMCEIETKQTIENYIKLNREYGSKKLTQMLEASIIRKGISYESLDLINKHLEGILRNIPNGTELSADGRKKEVEGIWDSLRENILSKHKNEPIANQIDKEVKEAFSHLSSEGFYQRYKKGESPNLSEHDAYKAYKLFPKCLETKDVNILEEKLDNLVYLILKERASDHYYSGIVRDLTKEIDKALDKNNELCKKFLTDFKWNAYLYAFLKFRPKMVLLQKKWEMDNTPLGILDQKKEEYLNVIDTRLQYGHELVSEGHIVGNYLLRVIYKKAMDAGNLKRKNAVHDIGWLTCAENVRLKYFEKLAKQVQSGSKKEAIKHFSNPKSCMEEWFISIVDGTTSANPKQKYNDTFNSEFKRVVQEIRNCKCFKEIKNFVNDYMIQVENVDYKLDLEDIEDDDSNLFQHAIEDELDTKKDNYYTRDELFQAPSKDKSIMGMLGCTETCYFCGALCWGTRGHHNDSGETKRHHTSHQPCGLANVYYKDLKELIAMPCHKTPDDTKVRYFGNEEPKLWSVVKSQDFSDWRFESHYKYMFNDLMCWFFEKLHNDLAELENIKPATYDDLARNGCLNLSYADILSTLKENFGD